MAVLISQLKYECLKKLMVRLKTQVKAFLNRCRGNSNSKNFANARQKGMTNLMSLNGAKTLFGSY